MRTLDLDSWNSYEEALAECRKAVLADKFAVLPTDTLYGLCANALSGKAVKMVNEAKGRGNKPVSIIVSDLVMMRKYAEVPDETASILQELLPGPCTVLLNSRWPFPEAISPDGIVGVRIPHYKFTTTISKQLELPLTATSANLSGGKSPTRISDVPAAILKSAGAIVDGGPTRWGEGSTIIDFTKGCPTIVRRGAQHEFVSQLLAIAGGKQADPAAPQRL